MRAHNLSVMFSCLESVAHSLQLRSAVLRAFAAGTEPLCKTGAFVDPFTATQVARRSACGAMLEAVCMPVFHVLQQHVCRVKFSAALTHVLREQLCAHFEDRRLARTLLACESGTSEDIRVEVMSFVVCTVRFASTGGADALSRVQWSHVPVAPLHNEAAWSLVRVSTLCPFQWTQMFELTPSTGASIAATLHEAVRELLFTEEDVWWTPAPVPALPSSGTPRMHLDTAIANVQIEPVDVHTAMCIETRVAVVCVCAESRVLPVLSVHTTAVTVASTKTPTTLELHRGISAVHVVLKKSAFADLTCFRQRVCKAAARVSKCMMGDAGQLGAFERVSRSALMHVRGLASWTTKMIQLHRNLPSIVFAGIQSGQPEYIAGSHPFPRTLVAMSLLTSASDNNWEAAMSPRDTAAARTCLEHGYEFARLMTDCGMLSAASKFSSLQDLLAAVMRHVLTDAGKRACADEPADALHAQIAMYITHSVHLTMVQVVSRCLESVRTEVFTPSSPSTLLNLQDHCTEFVDAIPAIIGVVAECERFMQWTRQAASGPATTDFVIKDTVKIPVLSNK
jgi:hypothetical protein